MKRRSDIAYLPSRNHSGGVKTLLISLTHGSFGLWLSAEFGWAERPAQNYMAAAEWAADKYEIISVLALQENRTEERS